MTIPKTEIFGYIRCEIAEIENIDEDVVEASKISSGNINLEFVNLNLVDDTPDDR